MRDEFGATARKARRLPGFDLSSSYFYAAELEGPSPEISSKVQCVGALTRCTHTLDYTGKSSIPQMFPALARCTAKPALSAICRPDRKLTATDGAAEVIFRVCCERA